LLLDILRVTFYNVNFSVRDPRICDMRQFFASYFASVRLNKLLFHP